MNPSRRPIVLSTVLLFLTASLLTGCVSGSKIRADAEVVKRDIAKAREQGAYKCAPRDLALAETNVEFTLDELSEGDWLRAADHVKIALAAVKRAVENSKGCNKKVIIKAPPKVQIIKKADTDGDGIYDVDDKCPNDAEDFDKWEDEDGCPDFDNDGDGIPDYPAPEDKCPNVKGVPENNGCPDKDTDGDGIADRLDKCPEDPEDKDGFEDEDGCPDPDNDGDGIIDYPTKDDKCPDVAEDKDGFEDEDGCPDPDNDGDGIIDYPTPEDKCPNEAGPPDSPQGKGCPRKYKLVKINREQKRIEIKQKVHFQTGKWRILPKSYGLLNDVAQVLKDFPKMRVSIEGHTDSRGSDQFNQRLSENRANSVREHLIKLGIRAERLQSIGFGESKPIASNRTARGREANRRVEFRILD
jgi:OmpA-OmpF porin, OOP family